jgi:arsenate reductase-like glutaredoxin family protein
VKELVLSRHAALADKDALRLAQTADRLVATKGAKVTELDLRQKPKKDEILALMLGPTGGLRAPTLIVGKTIYVGFPKDGGFDGLR